MSIIVYVWFSDFDVLEKNVQRTYNVPGGHSVAMVVLMFSPWHKPEQQTAPWPQEPGLMPHSALAVSARSEGAVSQTLSNIGEVLGGAAVSFFYVASIISNVFSHHPLLWP